MECQLIKSSGGKLVKMCKQSPYVLIEKYIFDSGSPDRDVRCFMALFRFEFPNATITPKMHILEEHVVPWVKEYKAGLGFFAEVGVEASHSGLKIISPFYDTVPSKPRQLVLKLNAHLLYVHPEQRSKQPKVQRRGPYNKET